MKRALYHIKGGLLMLGIAGWIAFFFYYLVKLITAGL